MKQGVLVLFLSVLAVQAQTLRIGGGAAPMENILKPIQTAFEKKTGIKLKLSQDGPDTAFKDVDAGTLDAATAGLSFEGWLELMASKGYPVKDPKAYQVTTIGTDRIHVLMHPDVAITEMTKVQVKGVFTGRITNWKQIGGPDLPIVLVLGTKVPGTNKVFQEQVLEKEPFANPGRSMGTTPEILASIAQTPGAIGIGPLSTTDDWKVWAPKLDFELGRPVILLTKGPHSAGVHQLLAFIHSQGK